MIATVPANNYSTLQAIDQKPRGEGYQRLKRAVLGVDIVQIERPRRALSERIIDLLVGLALILPIINAIIWICMQKVGGADTLSARTQEIPYTEWTEAADAARKPRSV